MARGTVGWTRSLDASVMDASQERPAQGTEDRMRGTPWRGVDRFAISAPDRAATRTVGLAHPRAGFAAARGAIAIATPHSTTAPQTNRRADGASRKTRTPPSAASTGTMSCAIAAREALT